ncbi:cytochrome P450 [Nocardia callitridis]|uniref:Cytochrome P450 n=1 Tax=Nocardia callitridis TaxID=648753 RepID=A0ABP9KV65_9NOCA
MTVSTREIPTSDLDLFTDAARLDPYPLYERLRALGPVVYLSKHDVYAIPRYAEACEVLDDWGRYSSARGVMMNPQLNEQLAERVMLCTDPPDHTAIRALFGRPMRAEELRNLRPRLEQEAESIVERLTGQESFDAVTDLAEHLPMTVVSTLVGLGEHGRQHMRRWAGATWEAQGAPNARTEAAEPVVEEFISFAMTEAVPGKLEPDGWAAQLYTAADNGEIRHDQCPFFILDYVTPSLDTTIHGITNAVRLFAEHPDQWDLVRHNPGLISHALNETLRLESPVQQFSRVVTETHELGGVPLEAGSRVLVLFGSANRDERKYPDPKRFDVTRRPSDHLAFGRGEHACVGMPLARLEMNALLRALSKRVARFDIIDSTPLLSNALNGLERLEVSVRLDDSVTTE